ANIADPVAEREGTQSGITETVGALREDDAEAPEAVDLRSKHARAPRRFRLEHEHAGVPTSTTVDQRILNRHAGMGPPNVDRVAADTRDAKALELHIGRAVIHGHRDRAIPALPAGVDREIA